MSVVLAVAACSSSATPTPPPATSRPSPAQSPATAFPLTVTDDEGTSVTIAERPAKIVSLTPATTEILFKLGVGDRVVAKVEDIAKFPPEADALPVVGTFTGVDVEKIVGLGTDLVIAGGSGGTQPEAINKLRALAIPVVVVYAADIEGVFKDIELTGAVVGEAAAARDLTASMRAGFDQVAVAMRDVAKPRVFYETGDQPAIYGIADQSAYAAMIELAGGKPVTTGSATNWEMSTERLVTEDPELIILGDSAYGVTPEAVAKRPGWSILAAVKAGAIKPIDDIVVTRPGPRLVEGLHALVAAIHPEVSLPAAPAPSPVGSAGG